MKRIGFIGIGVMGKSMARNLMRGGCEVAVYTRTKEKARELLAAGATWCESAGACAAGRDAVITMVGYPADVEQVYFGPEGIIAQATPGAYLIDMTTTSPALSQRIYREGRARGLHALDAPVSGGDVGAQNAALSIMVGGDEPDFRTCLPLLGLMGKQIVYQGGPGKRRAYQDGQPNRHCRRHLRRLRGAGLWPGHGLGSGYHAQQHLRRRRR